MDPTGEEPDRDEAELGACHYNAPQSLAASTLFQPTNGSRPQGCGWPVCRAADFCSRWEKA